MVVKQISAAPVALLDVGPYGLVKALKGRVESSKKSVEFVSKVTFYQRAELPLIYKSSFVTLLEVQGRSSQFETFFKWINLSYIQCGNRISRNHII